MTFNDEYYSLTQPDTNEYLLLDRKCYRSTFISEAFMNFCDYSSTDAWFAESVQLTPSSAGLIYKLRSNGGLHVTD